MNENDNFENKLEKQLTYYKNIAKETGRRRFREVEQLNRLIVKLKKSENALQESEQRFRLIAQSTNDIFYEWNIESGKLIWFGSIDSALGYEDGKVQHTLDDWLRLIHPEDRHLLDHAVLQRKESTIPISCIYRVMCKDDSIRIWNDVSSPVLVQEGKSKRWVGGISDITQQKRAEEALIQAQRLSAIGELSSGVSHDFNNSLQGILGNIELALLEQIPLQTRDYLETINQLVADAASRIQQLQRFSGKNKYKKDYEHLNLNQILDDVVLQTRPLWKDESEKAGITIAVEKSFAEKELGVEANVGELRSVLYNLVKNSVQAMPEGGKLIIESKVIEMSVYVTVSDTGKGMDEKTKARVFQPFFTTKSFEQGKGLGMSTSYAIIKEHNGEIYVKESVLGKGSSIEIVLPHSKSKESKESKSEMNASTSEGSIKVLWVDDEESIRDLARDQFVILDQHLDLAASGEEALDLLQINQYDLMITDVGMPNMNGWQLAERIMGRYPDMKIAVITGWGADVSNEENYGVDCVFGKPVRMVQLKNLIDRVLQLKQKTA
ncbi:MAG: response regulator [Candidatus Brocadiaceae bacterium]|nr:response regulator [Candidatus Brocadiaceae bacterium]